MRHGSGAFTTLTMTTQAIGDNAIVTVDSADAADDEYARFTANGIEGRTAAEVKADLHPAPGAIGETTPGTIRSLIKEVVKASGGSITALDCSGTIVNNYGQSADATLTLPAAATGLSFVVALGTTVAKYYRIDPDAGDQIFLDGTGAGDGKYVGIASAAAGKAISFMAIKTGESSYDWIATTISGTWAAE